MCVRERESENVGEGVGVKLKISYFKIHHPKIQA